MRTIAALRILFVLLLPLAATPASAAPLSAEATLTILVGPSPGMDVVGDPVDVAVSSGTGGFVIPPGAISGFAPPQPFTGVPPISSLAVSVQNLTLTQAGGSASGIVEGNLVLYPSSGVLNNLMIPLALGAGYTIPGGAAALALTVTYGSDWTTGVVSVTGVTTADGATGTTVFTTGSDARTAGHGGTMTLVTPARLLTNATGNLPILGRLTVHFTPEPALLALLGSAALAIAAAHRCRRRR